MYGLGFRGSGIGLRVDSSGFRAQGSKCMVQGSGSRVWVERQRPGAAVGPWSSGTGYRVPVLVSRVQGFGSASEQRGKYLKRVKELHLKAKARIWP